MFHVGQKVEFVGPDDSVLIALAPPPWNKIPTPKHKTPYTVANVCISSLGEECIELLELPQPGISDLIDPGFISRFFRPIVERKTDISVFTEMLNKVPELI